MEIKEKVNIGIVGYGFVGKAIAHGFQNCNLVIADPILNTSTKNLTESGLKFEAVFISVPTPMGNDGSINCSIVQSVLDELRELDTLLVLKSTVVPDLVSEFSKKYKNFIYNPEFLTEKNALNDFEFPIMHVFGGDPEKTKQLGEIYDEYSICWPGVEKICMTAPEASFVKYGINTFLSTKLTFWNQFHSLAQSANCNYDTIINAIGKDKRVGAGHTAVPGPDGKLGWGGACFKKDSMAFIKYAGDGASLLNEANIINNKIRSQYELDDREKEQNVKFSI